MLLRNTLPRPGWRTRGAPGRGRYRPITRSEPKSIAPRRDLRGLTARLAVHGHEQQVLAVIAEVGQRRDRLHRDLRDSSMGHAYIAAEGCEETVLLDVCSSTDEQLLESLMTLYGDEPASPARRGRVASAARRSAF